MRIAPCLLLVALVACAPVRGDDDGDSCVTALRVCAHWGDLDDPVDDGSARVRAPEGDPLESPLGTDGCATFELGEGVWEWQASNSFGDCVSVFDDVVVDACSTALREVDLTQWCMDGDQGPVGR